MTAKSMSDEQKSAMAQGRRESRIVENYLEYLSSRHEARSQRSIDEIRHELDAIEAALDSASMIERLGLLQQREDLHREALELAPEPDGQIEEQFVLIAKAYGERRGISYSTWREIGVSKDVLEAAGIARSRRPNQSQLGKLRTI